MANEPELLKFLELSSQRMRHHHDALWEEEKHYSWWIYIILAGLVYLYIKLPSLTVLETWQKILFMVLGSLFGFFISIMGYYVVRREGEYLHMARQIQARVIVALGLNQPYPQVSDSLMPQDEFSIKDWNSVRAEANKSFLELIKSLFSPAYSPLCRFLAKVFKKKPKKNTNKNFSIRDGFQLTFLFAAFLFIALLVVSLITLI